MYKRQELIYRLRGMFAFVLWDAKNKRMFGARDIFGIKPFYYYPVPDGSGPVSYTHLIIRV